MNEDLRKMLEAAREASRGLNRCQESDINRLLLSAADKVEAAIDKILAANATDLARMDKDNPKYDRLKLTPDRIRAIAADMRSVASLPSPLRRTLAEWTQPNGMRIRKVSVPFGVVGVIYEARPNVTFDVFSILMKSGNACVLKGGSDADASNRAAGSHFSPKDSTSIASPCCRPTTRQPKRCFKPLAMLIWSYHAAAAA